MCSLRLCKRNGEEPRLHIAQLARTRHNVHADTQRGTHGSAEARQADLARGGDKTRTRLGGRRRWILLDSRRECELAAKRHAARSADARLHAARLSRGARRIAPPQDTGSRPGQDWAVEALRGRGESTFGLCASLPLHSRTLLRTGTTITPAGRARPGTRGGLAQHSDAQTGHTHVGARLATEGTVAGP